MNINRETRLLMAQLRAIPRLPPNTLLETDQEMDEQLLQELLSIDPNYDPVQWLMDSRSDLCVKLLLWKQLDLLRLNFLSARRVIARKKKNIFGDEYQQSTLNIGYTFNPPDLHC